MTSSSSENVRQALLDPSGELPEVRPFPEIATRIIAACDDPDIRPTELSEIIQCDPAVTLRILRVANSSAYGSSGEVRTLKHAIVVLGFRALRNLAITVAAADLFEQGSDPTSGRQSLWQHSMACAAIASLLSKHVADVTTEEAFLAGIVHDVGKLIFYDLAADQYHQLHGQADSRTILEIETNAFGLDHQTLGMRCADEWGLPFEIAETIGSHHTPTETNERQSLVSLIEIADVLAHHWQIGGHRPGPEDADTILHGSCLTFPTEVLDSVAEQAPQEFQSLQSAYSA